MKKTLLLLSITLIGGLTAQADLATMTAEGYRLGQVAWADLDALTTAANGGDAKAMYVLAWAYDEGVGVKENDKTADNWYKKSAEGLVNLANTGDVDAILALGDMHEEGDGVVKDEKKAADFFQKAANASSAEGLYRLAECYADGDGVPRDIGKAKELYKKAIELNHPKAAKELQELEQGDD